MANQSVVFMLLRLMEYSRQKKKFKVLKVLMAALIQPNANAGDFRFKNLNNDSSIDGSDYTWIGNPWPKLTYGASITLGYKLFDLIVFFQGSYGNDIYAAGVQRHLDFPGFRK